ncbi:hypothetical protein E3P77_00753 [Wallemia ichthyophaga]|nr:hypothetical protein E3P77_00753 [Wallemia ichthyophaga]
MTGRLKFKKSSNQSDSEIFDKTKEKFKRRCTRISPPRYAYLDEPISPPRKTRRRRWNGDDADAEEEEFNAKLYDVGGEDGAFEAYVPPRWRGGESYTSYLDTFLNDSDDDERYAENIRQKMWEKSHPGEAQHAREFAKMKSDRRNITSRAKYAARDEIHSEQAEQAAKQINEAEKQAEAKRQSFRSFWLNTPGKITSSNIKYPSFDGCISESSVSSFLQLSHLRASDKKRVVRDVMRIFHPDKFVRYESQIPTQEYDSIKEKVSMITRILIHLLE